MKILHPGHVSRQVANRVIAIVNDNQLAIGVVLAPKIFERLRHKRAPVVSRHDAGNERPRSSARCFCSAVKIDVVAKQFTQWLARDSVASKLRPFLSGWCSPSGPSPHKALAHADRK